MWSFRLLSVSVLTFALVVPLSPGAQASIVDPGVDVSVCNASYNSLNSRVSVWYAAEKNRIKNEYKARVSELQRIRNAKYKTDRRQAVLEYRAGLAVARGTRDFYLKLASDQYYSYRSAATSARKDCRVTGYWNPPHYAGEVV